MGFTEAVRTMKTMASNAGLTICISTASNRSEEYLRLFNSIKPDVKTELHTVQSVSQWQSPQDQMVQDGDIICLLAARQQQVSWKPILDRIPRQLAVKAKNNNLIVIYPSEVASEYEHNSAPLRSWSDLRKLVDLDSLVIRSSAKDANQLIDQMLDACDQSRVRSDKALHSQVKQIVDKAAIELSPGIVLLHLHTKHAKTATVLVATAIEEVYFSKIDKHARGVLLLLSPINIDPTEHLKHLAAVANAVQDQSNIDLLLNAETADDFAWAFEQSE